MKNKLLYLAIIAIGTVSLSFAFDNIYGSGKVIFNAQISDNSCKITVNNQDDTNVYLSPISLDEIYNSAPAAYLKPQSFTITLSDCQLITEQQKEDLISVYWSGGNLIDNANTESLGYLMNALPNGAKNIAFALSINDSNTISQLNKIVPSSLSQLKPKGITIGNNKIIYTYYIGYVTQNPKLVTTGPIFSFATYDIEYN